MKRETSVQNLLFDVDQVPVEAIIGLDEQTLPAAALDVNL